MIWANITISINFFVHPGHPLLRLPKNPHLPSRKWLWRKAQLCPKLRSGCRWPFPSVLLRHRNQTEPEHVHVPCQHGAQAHISWRQVSKKPTNTQINCRMRHSLSRGPPFDTWTWRSPQSAFIQPIPSQSVRAPFIQKVVPQMTYTRSSDRDRPPIQRWCIIAHFGLHGTKPYTIRCCDPYLTLWPRLPSAAVFVKT